MFHAAHVDDGHGDMTNHHGHSCNFARNSSLRAEEFMAAVIPCVTFSIFKLPPAVLNL